MYYVDELVYNLNLYVLLGGKNDGQATSERNDQHATSRYFPCWSVKYWPSYSIATKLVQRIPGCQFISTSRYLPANETRYPLAATSSRHDVQLGHITGLFCCAGFSRLGHMSANVHFGYLLDNHI